MGLRIQSNLAALFATHRLGDVQDERVASQMRLASGSRLQTAADGSAALGISDRMRVALRSQDAAARNALDGLSLVATAEGALAESSELLARMRELAVAAANGTASSSDRAAYDAEFQGALASLDRIAATTAWNGIDLLSGSAEIAIQVGRDAGEQLRIELVASDAAALGIDGASLGTSDEVTQVLDDIDAAIGGVAQQRARLGAVQNRLANAHRAIVGSRDSLALAESRIRDVDVALESAAAARDSIRERSLLAVLGQANVQPQLAVALLA